MSGDEHDAARDQLIARVRARPGVVVVVGDVDTGKTTVTRGLLTAGLDSGLVGAWIDTDLGQSTVGPPTMLGLRRVRSTGDLVDPVVADQTYFVGSVTPRGSMLPIVAGAARLLSVARPCAGLVVVDTSGFTRGPAAQRLKLHLLELAAPVHVVGLQHEREIEPLLALARRFTAPRPMPSPYIPRSSPASNGSADHGGHRSTRTPRRAAHIMHGVASASVDRGVDVEPRD